MPLDEKIIEDATEALKVQPSAESEVPAAQESNAPVAVSDAPAAESAVTPEAPAEDAASSVAPENNAETSESSSEDAEKNKPSSGEDEEKNETSVMRSELLKRLLVDNYKDAKNEKDNKKEETKKSGKLAIAQTVGEKLSAAAEMYDNSQSIGKNASKIKESLFKNKKKQGEDKPADKPEEKPAEEPAEKSEEKPAEKPEEKSADNSAEKPSEKTEEKKEEKKEEKPLPIKEMLTDASGAYNNTVGAVSSLFDAKRTKSKRNKTRGRIRGAQHIMSAIGSLSGGIGTLLGTGKVGSGSDINIASGALSGASGILAAISSALGLIGDAFARKQSKKIAGNAEAFSKDSNKYLKLNNTSEEVRKLKSGKADMDPEQYEKELAAAKKKRSTEKANKISMAIASKFNKQKSETSNKGIGNVIAGSSKMLSGIFSAVGISGNSFVKDILSPVLNKGAAFAKEKLEKRDKDTAEEEKKKDSALRMETIKEYLDGKRERIKAQAKAAANSSELSDDEKGLLSAELSDSEADKIALARLGVSVSDLSSDAPATDADLMSGFEKVIMKRANNIMMSSNKDEMLDALMLSRDATAEDVAAALKGE